MNPNRAAWRISWRAEAAAWNGLASASTRLGPPEVHTNQTLQKAKREQLAMSYEDSIVVKHLNNCPALKPADLRQKVLVDLKQRNFLPQADLYQSIAARADQVTGTLELELMKDKSGLVWMTAQNQNDVLKGSRFIVGPRLNRWVSSARQTKLNALPAVAVVSPVLYVDPCAIALASSLLNAHQWRNKDTRMAMLETEPSLEKLCSGSVLEPLMKSFFAVKRLEFPKTEKGQPGGTDMRVGMETLASIILKAGQITTDENNSVWGSSARSCLLQAIRVVFEYPPPSN